ncbi:MAG: hypothetical protein IJZ85_13715 [Lachnospiraceae bacterium]|nr:hypothetical protein [Lachnospiraceae bacterium]
METKSETSDSLYPVQIPIQMMSITDRDGRLTPIWFKFETEDHFIEKIMIEKTISRDESNKVGIREKRFICSAIFGEQRRLLEIRYRIESQQWRIFQFLS